MMDPLDPELLAFRQARLVAGPRKGHVYIIEAEGLARVKIGWSGDLPRRLAALRNMSPVDLSVVWTRRAIQELEFELHRRFRAHRIWPRKEWFHFAPAIRTFVDVPFSDPPETGRQRDAKK